MCHQATKLYGLFCSFINENVPGVLETGDSLFSSPTRFVIGRFFRRRRFLPFDNLRFSMFDRYPIPISIEKVCRNG